MMIDHEYGQMSPLYGAMSVCSSTIAWLEAGERERSDWEFHTKLSKLGSAIQDFLNVPPGKASSPDMPMARIEFMVCCLGVVTSLATQIIQKARRNLPNTSDRFRQPIGFLVDQIEEMVDRVEDMSEAWVVPLDPELAKTLDLAIGQIDSTKTDIPDWREAIELLSD